MRIIAKFLTVIVILCALAAGYVVWASDAALSTDARQVAAAADSAEQFAQTIQDIADGRDNVALLTDEAIGAAEDYVFVTYTIHIKNRDILPMEWFSLTFTPREGDVAVIKNEIPDVPAFDEAAFTFTLLTARGPIDYSREIRLDYFFYAHEKHVEAMIGA